ncbi:hypothetical protein ACER0C_002978 [Sarotherodon galilaeus]
MPAVEGDAEFEKLTRRHAVKLIPTVNCSVEDAVLAVGEVVGYDSMKSASRINGAIVIFLDKVPKVNELVESGGVIHKTFTTILPLVSPAKKITISNAPPFIKNETLAKELSQHGQLVSPIKMVSLGCKSVLLKHVVCHRRQVFMILKDPAGELNLSFSFKIEGFNYMVFASSESMKCFGCGGEGHLIRSCPERLQNTQPTDDAIGEPVPARAPGRDSAIAHAKPAETAGGSAVAEVDPAAEAPVENRHFPSSNRSDETGIVKSVDGVETDLTNDQSAGFPDTSQTADTALESVCNDLCEDDNMLDEDLLKLSQKRKSSEPAHCSTKTSKAKTGNRTGESSMESESDLSLSQEHQNLYSPAEIRKFLQTTKGLRMVKVEDYFPYLKLFVESSRVLTKKIREFY